LYEVAFVWVISSVTLANCRKQREKNRYEMREKKNEKIVSIRIYVIRTVCHFQRIFRRKKRKRVSFTSNGYPMTLKVHNINKNVLKIFLDMIGSLDILPLDFNLTLNEEDELVKSVINFLGHRRRNKFTFPLLISLYSFIFATGLTGNLCNFLDFN
jgi:hypothetical protein